MSFRLSTELWAIPCILLLPLAYTYAITAASTFGNPPPPLGLPYLPSAEKLDQARRLRADRQKLEAQQRRLAGRPFAKFSLLPAEVQILVFEHCAAWPTTFSALVRVSKAVQALTYTSCLPLLPIRLITPPQLDSFELFLEQKPELALLVRHLWITPLHDLCAPTAVVVLKKCTNLLSLACTSRLLQDGVTAAFANYTLHHRALHQLTLLYNSNTHSSGGPDSRGWDAALCLSPAVARFFAQLTHLRLVGDRALPAEEAAAFPRLAHISFAYSARHSFASFTLAAQLLDAHPTYPALEDVVLVRSRSHVGQSVRMWRKQYRGEDGAPGTGTTEVQEAGTQEKKKLKRKNVFVFEIPAQRTELDLWCDNALGRGFWDLCTNGYYPQQR